MSNHMSVIVSERDYFSCIKQIHTVAPNERVNVTVVSSTKYKKTSLIHLFNHTAASVLNTGVGIKQHNTKKH